MEARNGVQLETAVQGRDCGLTLEGSEALPNLKDLCSVEVVYKSLAVGKVSTNPGLLTRDNGGKTLRNNVGASDLNGASMGQRGRNDSLGVNKRHLEGWWLMDVERVCCCVGGAGVFARLVVQVNGEKLM